MLRILYISKIYDKYTQLFSRELAVKHLAAHHCPKATFQHVDFILGYQAMTNHQHCARCPLTQGLGNVSHPPITADQVRAMSY